MRLKVSLPMWSALALLPFGLLLYATQALLRPASVAMSVVYIGTVIYPSAAFWAVLWAQSHGVVVEKTPGTRKRSVALGIAIGLVALAASFVRGFEHGALSVLVIWCYVYGWVLGLVALDSWPCDRGAEPRKLIAGKIALGLSLQFWLTGWALEAIGASAGVVMFLGVVVVVTLLAAFSSVMRGSTWEAALGLLAVANLVYLVPSSAIGASLFVGIWSSGPFFWPAVILTILSVEGIVFRVARRAVGGGGTMITAEGVRRG